VCVCVCVCERERERERERESESVCTCMCVRVCAIKMTLTNHKPAHYTALPLCCTALPLYHFTTFPLQDDVIQSRTRPLYRSSTHFTALPLYHISAPIWRHLVTNSFTLSLFRSLHRFTILHFYIYTHLHFHVYTPTLSSVYTPTLSLIYANTSHTLFTYLQQLLHPLCSTDTACARYLNATNSINKPFTILSISWIFHKLSLIRRAHAT